MVFARKLTVRFADFVGIRATLHVENLVIILSHKTGPGGPAAGGASGQGPGTREPSISRTLLASGPWRLALFLLLVVYIDEFGVDHVGLWLFGTSRACAGAG